jgi:hypothetical protein
MEAEGKLVIKELDIDKFHFSRNQDSLVADNATEPQYGNGPFYNFTNSQYNLYQQQERYFYYVPQIQNTRLVSTSSFFYLNKEDVHLFIDIELRIQGKIKTINFPLPIDAEDVSIGNLEISDPNDSNFTTNLGTFSIDDAKENAVLFSNLLDNTYCDELHIKASIHYKKKI